MTDTPTRPRDVPAPPSTTPPTPAGPAATGPADGPQLTTAQVDRPSALQAMKEQVRESLRGTPGRLRVLGAVSVLACVLVGVVAFVGVRDRASALAGAESDAAQLVRIQTIRTNLVSADASLTNAFLVGGLESSAEREVYARGIDTASRTLAEAAGADPRDAAVLDEVNRVLTTYTGLVEAARTNNRQGFPIGAAYLRQATLLLRNDALPALRELVQAGQERVEDAYAASHRASDLVTIPLGAALVILLVTQAWLALRTRRWINVGLAAATIALVVVGVVVLGTMALSQSRADDARAGPYRAAVSVATARTDAFDAKSAESLTLIARGSGETFDARFDTLSANATEVLDEAAGRSGASDDEDDARTAFAAYLEVHDDIREADEGGDFDGAVELATAGGDDGANARFAAFDRASGQALADRAEQVDDDLSRARRPLTIMAWLALAVGVVAAVAAGRGVSTRLKEYR